MGRSLLLCETMINGQPLIVGTVHLESLSNAVQRKKQMDIAFPVLKAIDNSFLMGDFNFNSTWKNEQESIDP